MIQLQTSWRERIKPMSTVSKDMGNYFRISQKGPETPGWCVGNHGHETGREKGKPKLDSTL